MFFTQLVDRAEIRARSGQDSTQIGFLPSATRSNNHRIWSYGLSFRYIAVRHTASHMAVAAANAHIFIDHNKTSSRLCIAPLGQTLVQAGSSSGCTKSTDSRQTRSGARHRYFLPVATSIFINAAEADFWRQSL